MKPTSLVFRTTIVNSCVLWELCAQGGEEWGGSSQRENDTGFQMGRTNTHKDMVLGSLPRAEPGVGLREPALSPVGVHGPLGERICEILQICCSQGLWFNTRKYRRHNDPDTNLDQK